MGAPAAREWARLVQAILVTGILVALALPAGLLALAIAAAAFTANGRRLFAAAPTVLAGTAAGIAARQPDIVALIAAAGLLGGICGEGLRRRAGYGKTVWLAAGAGFGVYAASLALHWEEAGAVVEAWRQELAAYLDTPEGKQLNEAQIAVREMQVRIAGEWPHVVFGSAFATALFGACFVLTAVSVWQFRREGPPASIGTFSAMRPSDWLVWGVIAAALMAFGDQRWPNDALRFVSWNLGLALAGVYWLNGLGIIVHGLSVWRPHPFMLAAIALLMVLSYMISWLPLLGLFDTWAGFRRRIDHIAAARAAREDSHDGSD